MTTVYTIGHSTRPAEEFLAILDAFSIGIVADIRTVPRSRWNPQYDQDSLKLLMTGHGVEYVHLPALGGLRRARKDDPALLSEAKTPRNVSLNTGWENASFRGYADYMQTPEFAKGIEDLMILAKEKNTVILCAEAVPWRCHRSLVGDALLVRGVGVEDIMSATSSRPHKLTTWAHVDSLQITYPKPE